MNSETKTGSPPDWPSATAAGFRALACGQRDAAAGHWRDAQGALAAATPGDPRLAAGLTNIGAGAYLGGRMQEAREAFDAAEAAWLAAVDAIAVLELPVIGSSSAFHFTLASRNLPAFQDIRRKRLAALCEACLAVTRFNRLVALPAPSHRDRVEPAARKLAVLIAETFGPRAAEVRLLTDRSDDGRLSAYGDKASEFEGRQRSLSALLPDACNHLETATALTALIGPWLMLDTTVADETSRPRLSSSSSSVPSHE